MKKISLFTAIMLLAVGVFAQSADVQDVPKKRSTKHVMVTSQRPEMQQRLNKQHVADIPDLTDEQRNSMKQLKLGMEKEVRKNTNLIREKKAHLITLQGEDKPDQKAINKTIDEIAALQGQNMKARADFHLKVSSLLTDEQREIFQQRSSMREHKHFASRLNTTGEISDAHVICTEKFSNTDTKIRVFNSENEEIEIADWKSINPKDIKTISVTKSDKEKGQSRVDIQMK